MRQPSAGAEEADKAADAEQRRCEHVVAGERQTEQSPIHPIARLQPRCQRLRPQVVEAETADQGPRRIRHRAPPVLLHSDMVKGEPAARGKNSGAKRDRQQPAAAGPADDSDDRDQGGRAHGTR